MNIKRSFIAGASLSIALLSCIPAAGAAASCAPIGGFQSADRVSAPKGAQTLLTEYFPDGDYRSTLCTSSGVALETQHVEALPTTAGTTKLEPTEVRRPSGVGRGFVTTSLDYDRSPEPTGTRASVDGSALLPPAKAVSPAGVVAAKAGVKPPLLAKRALGTGDSCTNQSYTYVGGQIYTQYYPYRFNPNNIPGGGTNAIIAGHNAWNDTYNDCSFPDVTSINAAFDGYSSTVPTRNDGVNLIYFGSVSYCGSSSSSILACNINTTESTGTYYTDIDQVYVSGQPWSTNGSPSSSQYDLQATATHESGHAVGLGHSAGTSYLTMNSFIYNGATHQRTLGYGDARGLRCRYGVTAGGC